MSAAGDRGLQEIGRGEDLADGGRAGCVKDEAAIGDAGEDDVSGRDNAPAIGDGPGESSGAKMNARSGPGVEVVEAVRYRVSVGNGWDGE